MQFAKNEEFLEFRLQPSQPHKVGGIGESQRDVGFQCISNELLLPRRLDGLRDHTA
jgi:hypothetical protein